MRFRARTGCSGRVRWRAFPSAQSAKRRRHVPDRLRGRTTNQSRSTWSSGWRPATTGRSSAPATTRSPSWSTGRWTDYQVSYTWMGDIEALHLACAFDLKVPERRRAEVQALISLINEQLWVGHFDLWIKEGMVMFRHALVLAGGVEASGQQCEALLGTALDACERYFTAFQFVVWAGKTRARGARRRHVRDLGRGVDAPSSIGASDRSATLDHRRDMTAESSDPLAQRFLRPPGAARRRQDGRAPCSTAGWRAGSIRASSRCSSRSRSKPCKALTRRGVTLNPKGKARGRERDRHRGQAAERAGGACRRSRPMSARHAGASRSWPAARSAFCKAHLPPAPRSCAPCRTRRPRSAAASRSPSPTRKSRARQRKLATDLLAAIGAVEWVERRRPDGRGHRGVRLRAGLRFPAGGSDDQGRHRRRPAGRRSPRGWRAKPSPAPASCCTAPTLDAATLRQNVTSPGGTTAAALDVLMGPGGFDALLTQGRSPRPPRRGRANWPG